MYSIPRRVCSPGGTPNWIKSFVFIRSFTERGHSCPQQRPHFPGALRIFPIFFLTPTLLRTGMSALRSTFATPKLVTRELANCLPPQSSLLTHFVRLGVRQTCKG